jgi:signal transduction histidine kinase
VLGLQALLRRVRARLPRPTIRLKLTLWYGGMFLLAGALLVTLTYFLVREGFEPSQHSVRQIVAERLGIPPDQLEPGSPIRLVFPQPGLEPAGGVAGWRLIRDIQAEQMQQQLNGLLMWSGVALAIMAVVSLGLGWIVAGRLLRPVHELTGMARRLSESTLHERIKLQRPHDELKELADTFDAMLERLDRAFAGQRQFVANASHELRTPLTIIRTELDVALADPGLSREELEATGAAIREALARSEEVIDGLLVLARSDALADTEAVDLAELARESFEQHAAEADEAELGAELALSPAVVDGDRRLLGRMVDNLVQNAVRHNERRGWIKARTEQTERFVSMTIANGGPLVSAEDAPRLFERFFRTDASRSRRTGGTGLGLSIVKAVAEAHHGSVVAAPLADGGLEVRVTLPSGHGGSGGRRQNRGERSGSRG